MSDLRVGDTVMVLGTTDNGTIAATAIRVGVTPGVAGGAATAGSAGRPATGPGAPGSPSSPGGSLAV